MRMQTHRWQMLNLVCSSNKKFIADERELKRKAPSYTIDTLQELREEYGEHTVINIDFRIRCLFKLL